VAIRLISLLDESTSKTHVVEGTVKQELPYDEVKASIQKCDSQGKEERVIGCQAVAELHLLRL
jgi:hypothetical protein